VTTILEAAVNALNCLDKASITELKSFAKPPVAVHNTLSALMIMLNRDQSWASIRKTLSNPTEFIQLLICYDKDNMPEKMMK